MTKIRQPGRRAVLTETCFGENGVREAVARAYAALDQLFFTVSYIGVAQKKTRVATPSLGPDGGAEAAPMFLVVATGLHRHPERLRRAQEEQDVKTLEERAGDGTGEEKA